MGGKRVHIDTAGCFIEPTAAWNTGVANPCRLHPSGAAKQGNSSTYLK